DFLNIIRNQMLTCEKGNVGLWKMFQNTMRGSRRYTLTPRILGFDKQTFPYESAYKLPYTGEDTTRSKKVAGEPNMYRSIDSYGSLRKRMVNQIQAGNLALAIELYKTSKASGRVMKPVHLRLAAIASLFYETEFTLAKEILENN